MKILRLALLENRYTLAGLTVLTIALILGLASSYAATHPERVNSYTNMTITVSGPRLEVVNPPLIDQANTPLAVPENLTLTILSTTELIVEFTHPQQLRSSEPRRISPYEEYSVDVPLENPPAPIKCQLRPAQDSQEPEVKLSYRITWKVRSPLFYLSLPALLLSIIGAVLGIIGYTKYVQRLVEEL